MYLKDFLPNISKKFRNVFFSGISFDSSKVKKNYIFFAIKGNKVDGNNFINQAIGNGAKIIISEKKILKKNKKILFYRTNNIRKLLSQVSFKMLKIRPKNMVAVTGTNGKSSIADFYYQILDLNSKKVASIGTNGVKYGNKLKPLPNTTTDPINLRIILQDLKRKKIDNIILEASSHGLKQNRLDGLLFDIGIFTNLSHDHLDYHKTFKDYLNSKLYLFKKLIKKRGNIITDTKIPELKQIKAIARKNKLNVNLIFNKKKGVNVLSHMFEGEKQVIKISFKKKVFKFKLNLIGKIQTTNVLMALLAANKSKINFNKIINVIHKIKPVEGRLEKIGKIYNNSRVILDYAHTPKALELALLNLREQFPDSKINLVFGCGGDRDFQKRSLMGKISEKFSNQIYLTDDNPRSESPSKIRNDIKKGIKKNNFKEIPDRKIAIHEAIKNLNSGDILLVAGKGHEKIQDYGKKKIFFSDKKIILNAIDIKNKFLSRNLKLNVIKEQSYKTKLKNLSVKNISINSKTIKEKDIFFAIKGKKNDGNKFISEAFKKKASLAIVNRFCKKYTLSKQIKVPDSLKFLTQCSKIYRKSLNTKILAITGSCGKTTLKEMLGFTLSKMSKTSYSPKSFNNKYGVPLSLFNVHQKDNFGVLEVGMDKKGEIDALTKIIRPDLGIITNISYAHSRNFSNIKGIANAKAEIIKNIRSNGILILNGDDDFFNYHKKIGEKKGLKILSFGFKKGFFSTNLIKIQKEKKKYNLSIKLGKLNYNFFSNNINESSIYNILACLTIMNLFIDLKKINKNIFLNFKTPNGRGDISKIKIQNKYINLVDETYNSNPLSLKVAIENFDKIVLKKAKKYLILGDMLELGKHSLSQHKLMTKNINKSNIDKVYVIGNFIKETFNGLSVRKKARILNRKSEIIDLINKDLNNNDYLMIKGSNATDLHKITSRLKQGNLNVV